MRTTTLSLLVAASATLQLGNVYAEQMPSASPLDPRIRVVPYNSADSVRLNLAYGQRTHIELAADEVTKYISTGDDPAWDVGPERNIRNHIFIKPIAAKPDTNMVIVTNKRTYNFNLYLVKPAEYYASLLFTYPEEKREKAATKSLKNSLDEFKASSEAKDGYNTNYWAQGAEGLTPIRAWDDGRFTYLYFSPGAMLPAMYVEEEDGEETTERPVVDPETGLVTITRLVKKVILRRGDKLVAGVFNMSYSGPGFVQSTKTVSDSVRRVVKEAK